MADFVPGWYTVRSIDHNGKSIPDLRHIHKNVSQQAAQGFFVPDRTVIKPVEIEGWKGKIQAIINMVVSMFKPDKVTINLKRYPEWMDAFARINNNGPKSRALKYLQQLTSGVFQPWPKLQPCVFATTDFAPNRVWVEDVSQYYQGVQYAQIRTLSLKDDPPAIGNIPAMLAAGVIHKYVSIGLKGKTSPAPKDNGNVYIFVVGDGTPFYVEFDALAEIKLDAIFSLAPGHYEDI